MPDPAGNQPAQRKKADPEPEDMHAYLNTAATPLNALTKAELCPGAGALDNINAGLR